MKQKEAIKLLTLCGISIVFSVLGWLLIKVAFTRLHFEVVVLSFGLLTPLIISLLLLFAALAIFGIMTALAPRAAWGLWLSLALAVTGLVTVGLNIYSAIAAIIWGLGLSQLAVRIREEKQERRKVAIHKYMRSGINLGLSALLLAVSLCFYVVTIRSGGKQLDPIESLSVITVNRVNQYLTTQLPGYRSTMTVNEFLFLVAVKGSQQANPVGAAPLPEELNKQNIKVGVTEDVPDWIGVDINKINQQIEGISEQELKDQLPDDFLEQVKRNPQLLTDKFIQLQSGMIGQQIDQARNEIASQFKIEVGSNEPIGVVLERAIAQKYRDLFGPFVYLVPPLLALGLFFILQIFNFIFVIITMFIAKILFIGLRWAGFYRITERSAPTEVLELD